MGDRLYGSDDVDALFHGNPLASAPFTPAGRSTKKMDYDKDLVHDALVHPARHQLQAVDPRELRSTQPSVTRAGVQHYMNPDNPYEKTGETFAEQDNIGNRRPIVYDREDGERSCKLILSGHHRAAAALLHGKPLQAVVVRGGWGPKR